jgi:hypothetical protein
LTGETAAATEAIEHAESLSSAAELPRLVLMRVRSRARLATGDFAGARVDAEQVFDRSLEVGARIEAAEAALALSAAIRAQGDASEIARIEDVLATADRLIAETGARNLAPLVLLERAALLTRIEDASPRRDLFQQALDAFTRMGAGGRVREIALLLNV